MNFIDRLNMVLLWVIVSLGSLIIWHDLAVGGEFEAILEHELFVGCQNKTPDWDLDFQATYCSCIVDNFETLMNENDTWYGLDSKTRENIILENVYLPCNKWRLKKT